MLKRVGLIDNLSHIIEFRASKFENADAEQILSATGGNTGNVAFVYATQKLIANPVYRIGWGWSAEEVRRRCDLIVVCCANQLGNHVDLKSWSDRLQAFELPIVLVGLGAQSDKLSTQPSIPAGTLDFLATVAAFRTTSNNPNISTRGSFTSAYLASIGHSATATGCPSGLISPKCELGKHILSTAKGRKPSKIAVAAGNPWHKSSAPLEPKLKEIVNSFCGEYFLQHPKVMLQLALGDWESIPIDTRKLLVQTYEDLSDGADLVDWFRKNASIFIDVPNWMRRLSMFDAVIGPRFHGVALGIQAGIQGRVIAIDSRTSELASSAGIPQTSLEVALSLAPSELAETSRWTTEDAERLDQQRSRSAAAFHEFILSNDLAPSEHLINLAH